MVSVQVRGRVGKDGILRLQVPTAFHDTEVEACVVLNPVATNGTTPETESKGWPSGYFEATAGSIDDETFKRWPQGKYKTRKPLE